MYFIIFFCIILFKTIVSMTLSKKIYNVKNIPNAYTHVIYVTFDYDKFETLNKLIRRGGGGSDTFA